MRCDEVRHWLEYRAVGGEAAGEGPGKGRLGVLTLQIDDGVAADVGERSVWLEDRQAVLPELDDVHAVARDGARDYGEGGAPEQKYAGPVVGFDCGVSQDGCRSRAEANARRWGHRPRLACRGVAAYWVGGGEAAVCVRDIRRRALWE